MDHPGRISPGKSSCHRQMRALTCAATLGCHTPSPPQKGLEATHRGDHTWNKEHTRASEGPGQSCGSEMDRLRSVSLPCLWGWGWTVHGKNRVPPEPHNSSMQARPQLLPWCCPEPVSRAPTASWDSGLLPQALQISSYHSQSIPPPGGTQKQPRDTEPVSSACGPRATSPASQ